ncbi:MAG TPA: Rho termination factor N-terminal domain-containing protein, partial [Actinomycetota bacterium]|nr:Rho termination factor N-terminal domain-containing protein [Actinomycetota bacterium]
MATTERDILEGKVLPELQAIASSMGVQGYQRLRKADLIGAIIAKAQGVEFEPSSPAKGRRRTRASSEEQVPEGAGEPQGGAPASAEVSGNGGQPAATGQPADAGAPPETLTEPSGNGEVDRAAQPTTAEAAPAGEAGASAESGAPPATRTDGAQAEQAQGDQQAQAAGGEQQAQSGTEQQPQAGAGEQQQAQTDQQAQGGGDQQQRGDGDRGQRRDRDRDWGGQGGGNRWENQQGQGQGGGRRRNRNRNRNRNRGGGGGFDQGNVALLERPDYRDRQQADDRPEVSRTGTLDIRSQDGYGFLRVNGYLPGSEDVYVPLSMIRRMGLRRGDEIEGTVKLPRDSEKYAALSRIDKVNGLEPEEARNRRDFKDLTPLYPLERLRLEHNPTEISTRIMDLMCPIGKGQRGMIVSPPKAGKTTLMKQIANAISENNPEVYLIILLTDERPEEVTDMQRSTKAHVIYSTFD